VRTLRQEHGFAVPLALAVIAIVAGFSAVAIALATHNVERSSRDRSSARALAAADAGLDTASYRMNKALVASRVDGLVPDGLVALTEETVGCLEVGIGTMSVELVPLGDCALSDAESLDATVDDDGLGRPATFRYWIKSVVDLGTGDSLIERRIVSVGEVDGVARRVMGIYRLDLAPPATALFSRASYVECTSAVPAAGTDPAAGC
jgi:hypothetical protein